MLKKIFIIPLLVFTMMLSACSTTSRMDDANDADIENAESEEENSEENAQEHGEQDSEKDSEADGGSGVRIDKNNLTVVYPKLEESNGASGFYILTENDPLAYNEDWSVRYAKNKNAIEGGVYIDGQLTYVYLMKIWEDRYYVALSDFGMRGLNGTTVTIDGTFHDGTNVVTFEKTTFVFNGSKWEQQ